MSHVISAIDLPIHVFSWSDLNQFNQLVNSLLKLPETGLSLWRVLLNQQQQEKIQKWLLDFENFQTKRRILLSIAHKSVLDANLTALESIWNTAKQTWFFPKWLQKRQVQKGLSAYSSKLLNEDAALDQFFSEFNAYQQITDVVKSREYDFIRQALSNSYMEEETDLGYIRKQVEGIKALNELLRPLLISPLEEVVSQWIANSKSNIKQLMSNQEQALLHVSKAWDTLLSDTYQFQQETQLDIRSYPVQIDWLTEIKEKRRA